MKTTKTYESPDGLLRFQVVHEVDGDVTLGFETYPWHTHGDLLVGSYGSTEQEALDRFVGDLLHGRSIIALYRRNGELYDIGITDDPQRDLRHVPKDESIEFRRWDGLPV